MWKEGEYYENTLYGILKKKLLKNQKKIIQEKCHV